jgi:phosphoribosylaminoimidazolecarboxamide formyltransferase/IMP cyclohydrolase
MVIPIGQVSALANGLIPQEFAASVDEAISCCQGEKYTNHLREPYTIAGIFTIQPREVPLIKVKRALMSVSDKSDLADFAHFLHQNQVEILSTGGTARYLKENGIPVVEVSQYTGFPEILDGRVKTLHPKIHGGLLAMRQKPEHQAQLSEQDIPLIDLVVVNLYPFEKTASMEGAKFDEVIEQIDIGGPSMVRSAAKNHASLAVVTDPLDYSWIQKEMRDHDCSLSDSTRFILAQKAFARTAEYDSAISTYLAQRVWSPDGGPTRTDESVPPFEVIALEKVRDLRYGENPHQRGALYRQASQGVEGVAGAEVLHGKALSYNNLLDADAAWNLVQEFDRAASAVIKHSNPSGVAQSDTAAEAYRLARDCDPVSAFGSVVSFNRTVDADSASEISSTFVEVVLAPEYSEAALEILTRKKNIRLLKVASRRNSYLQHRQIGGGYLVQDLDTHYIDPEDLKQVTKRAPTDQEIEALLFGWRVVKHVKSNAIVFASSSRTLGVGAGQMSRVDSVKWGAMRAILPLEGASMASDAFFPFPDGIIEAAGYGITSVIQPGGSIRDAEVIEAADAHGVAMVFTGIRHFKH